MEGCALGFSIGIGGVYCIGLATGSASGHDKLRKQLDQAIDDKEISIHDK